MGWVDGEGWALAVRALLGSEMVLDLVVWLLADFANLELIVSHDLNLVNIIFPFYSF